MTNCGSQNREVKMPDKLYWSEWLCGKLWGKFYSWGGDDPSGFDCSGVAVELCKSYGSISRGSDYTAADLAELFPRSTIEVGHLVFWANSDRIIHVEVVVDKELRLALGASGGGPWVKSRQDAIRYNAFIKIRPIHSRSGVWGYCNPFV
jgi:hypothetical protein